MQVAERFSQEAKYITISATVQSYSCHFKMTMDSKVIPRVPEVR